MSEGAAILIIKLDDLLNIPHNPDYIFLLDGVMLSLSIKYIGHPTELLRILGDVPFPLPLGNFEDLIIFFIGGKGEFSILLDVLHIIPCLFYSFP